VQENIKDTQGNSFRNAGVYNDELIREHGEWKFAVRKFHSMYRGPVDMSGAWVGFPEQ
jgi:hypothetical protein